MSEARSIATRTGAPPLPWPPARPNGGCFASWQRAIVLALIVLLAMAAPAAAADWRVDYAQSRLGFTARQGGEPFDGNFARFTAEVSFDAGQLAGSRAAVVIDMTSVSAGNAPRDATIREPDWFDVARFPQARFIATSFRNTGPDLYEANGELTIRDVTRPAVLPFRLTTAPDGAVRAEGALTINRTDYGIGRGAWARDDMVGFPVTIRVLLVATPAR